MADDFKLIWTDVIGGNPDILVNFCLLRQITSFPRDHARRGATRQAKLVD